MSLIPYLYNQAKYTTATGVPMMRSMAYEFPDDDYAADMEFQYMLGENLLVAPLENEGQTSKLIYLPEGEWIDLFWGAKRPGGSFITYNADVDELPVFVKSGSVIPMNLNADYDFGGSVGNSTDSYINFTFRIYPNGYLAYDYYDYVGQAQTQLIVDEDFDNGTLSLQVPAMTSGRSLQIFADKPGQVKVDGSAIQEYTAFDSFKTCASGWYYDAEQHLIYVRLGSSSASTAVEISGVKSAPYEAEFSERTEVTVNTNHTGFEGTGFVDGFAEAGDSVEFDVWVPTAGSYTLGIRYSAGTEAASRDVRINGAETTLQVQMPKTQDWDSWNISTATVTLSAGANTVKIEYGSGSSAGINLDNIRIYS